MSAHRDSPDDIHSAVENGNTVSAYFTNMQAWASDKWFSIVLQFRTNPQQFFADNQVSSDDFLLGILKTFSIEDILVTTKIQLLALLQEYASLFHDEHRKVEVFDSLLELSWTFMSSTSVILQNQIITTLTSLAVQFEIVVTNPTAFASFTELLLDTICQVNSASNTHTRSCACQCLMELELCYPGILSRKLEHLWQMCELDRTCAIQDYMSLFVTVLYGTITLLLSQTSQSLKTTAVTDALCNRREPLKPFILPINLDTNCVSLETKVCLPSHVDITQLQKSLMKIIDFIYLCTPAMQSYIIQMTMKTIAVTDRRFPNIFESISAKYSCRMDLPMQNTLYLLQGQFDQTESDNLETASALETKYLERLQNPLLPVSHRLLLIQWFSHWPETDGFIPQDPAPPRGLLKSQHKHFFPTVFDSLDMQHQKLSLLSLCSTPSSNPDLIGASMIGALLCFHKPLTSFSNCHQVAALFRTIYTYYSHHSESGLLQDIHHLVVKLVYKQPWLVPFTLDFVESIKQMKSNTGEVDMDILKPLVDNIISSKTDRHVADLRHHLQLLETAAQSTKIDPQGTLLFLIHLVEESGLCIYGEWIMGSLLLAVCCSLLRHHNTRENYAQLGTVLFRLFTEHSDIDIRDRAKFYYALLTCHSPAKVKALLAKTTYMVNTSSNIANIVPGGAYFPETGPIIYIPERNVIKIDWMVEKDESKLDFSSDIQDGDLLQMYHDNCSSVNHKKICLKLKIYLITEEKHLSELYALALTFSKPPGYRPIPEVKLSHLASDVPAEVKLLLEPDFSLPVEFSVSAEFTGNDSHTYCCDLQPFVLKFCHLCKPLPGIASLPSDLKHKLVMLLWRQLTRHKEKQQDREGMQTLESTLTVKMTTDSLSALLQNELEPFTVEITRNEEQSKETDPLYLLAIFLSPESHILIKVKHAQQQATFNFLTDNWTLLPQFSNYLKALINDVNEK